MQNKSVSRWNLSRQEVFALAKYLFLLGLFVFIAVPAIYPYKVEMWNLKDIYLSGASWDWQHKSVTSAFFLAGSLGGILALSIKEAFHRSFCNVKSWSFILAVLGLLIYLGWAWFPAFLGLIVIFVFGQRLLHGRVVRHYIEAMIDHRISSILMDCAIDDPRVAQRHKETLTALRSNTAQLEDWRILSHHINKEDREAILKVVVRQYNETVPRVAKKGGDLEPRERKILLEFCDTQRLRTLRRHPSGIGLQEVLCEIPLDEVGDQDLKEIVLKKFEPSSPRQIRALRDSLLSSIASKLVDEFRRFGILETENSPYSGWAAFRKKKWL